MNEENAKKENILLDARLLNQINTRAFRAELSNGHGFIAYVQDGAGRDPAAGETVRVCFSPFDMSVARIVFEGVK